MGATSLSTDSLPDVIVPDSGRAARRTPRTAYADSAGVKIAYQVFGNGPYDLVFVPGWVSHVDDAWTSPIFRPLLSELAKRFRVVLFDKRGTGASDRDVGLAPLEERMDDIRAVMDASGLERAVIFGPLEGGDMACLFAATFPERTAALILYGTGACSEGSVDNPGGYGWEANLRELIEIADNRWGEGLSLRYMASALSRDVDMLEAWGRWERTGASPRAARQLLEMCLRIDLRPVLPSIAVPTLVMHCTDDRAVPVECGRDLARRIPGARYVELAGEHLFCDIGSLIGEAEEFVTGSRSVTAADRVLTTVMFVDIVGSTEMLAAIGDRPWRDLLDKFEGDVRREVTAHNGRHVKATGDGSLAMFDGPARAVRCALAVRDAAERIGLRVRAGVHTGEVELRGADIAGIAVHVGARTAAESAAGEVLVTSVVRALVTGSDLRFADRGEHYLRGLDDPWRLFAAVGSRAEEPSQRPATYVLRDEGDSWSVIGPDDEFRLQPSKGLTVLGLLVADPDREHHAVELAGGVGVDGALVALDARAKESYRRRLSDLREEEREAADFDDHLRLERATTEIEALAHELAGALGLGGRDRPMASTAERARQSVTKTLKAALERIEARDSLLGRHLRTSVRTGTFCVYAPDPSSTIRFVVAGSR